jgi:circadian clock protein KaiC
MGAGLRSRAARRKARRLVVDSLSGFELALAPTFREDFRESLYRMEIRAFEITRAGIVVGRHPRSSM